MNEEFFGININHQRKNGIYSWFAIDGKELRGSIDGVAGQKRSENIVRILNHHDSSSKVICYYDGSKSSEKALVKTYFENQKSLKCCYSLDALHTSAHLMTAIHQRQGTYLAQVKANQKYLLEACKDIHNTEKTFWTEDILEKGHGRIERRKGYCYHIDPSWFARVWNNSGVAKLMVVERERTNMKTGNKNVGTYYYISNKKATHRNCKDIGIELFQAVRAHWSIETDHYIRDKIFGEDSIKCFNKWRTRAIAATPWWLLLMWL